MKLPDLPAGAELVAASIEPKRPAIEDARKARAADLYRRLGGYDAAAGGSARRAIDAGLPPIAGGATGLQGAAFMHNLPEEGSYVMDTNAFFRETERNDVPQEVKAFTGLGGGPIDLRISNVGVLAKIRLVFTGTLTIAGAGSVTANYQWPWNVIKRFTLNANGQTQLVSCEGMDLRARRQRIYRNPRDPISTAPATVNSATGPQTVDPSPGVIANGTYSVVLVYDVPIAHDDYTLTGSLFSQSDQVYLNWRVTPAAATDLFTIVAPSTATLTGNIASTLTFFDIPFADTQEGRKVLIPDLQWLHGYLSADAPFANTGDVKTPFIRTAGQLISFAYYLDNGGAAVIDANALNEIRFAYGGNRKPRVYSPPSKLLEKNAQDYNGRIIPAAGYAMLDLEVDNPMRDIVYPKGVTELQIENNIPTGTTINANAHTHFIEETLFAGR